MKEPVARNGWVSRRKLADIFHQQQNLIINLCRHPKRKFLFNRTVLRLCQHIPHPHYSQKILGIADSFQLMLQMF